MPTLEQMQQEAIKRLKTMKIEQGSLDEYIQTGKPLIYKDPNFQRVGRTEYKPKEQELIDELEKEYNCLVYALMYRPDFHLPYPILDFFYIPAQEEEWQEDQELLETEQCQYVWRCDYEHPADHEFVLSDLSKAINQKPIPILTL